MRLRKPNTPYPYPSSSQKMEDYDFLTVDELAKFFKMSTTTVYRIVESGILPVYRIARTLRFNKRDVIAYIESQKKDAWNWHLKI